MNVGCVFSLMVHDSPELPYGFSDCAFKRVVCGGDYRRLDSTADIRLVQGPPTAQKGIEKMSQNEAVLWLAAMLVAIVLSATGCGAGFFSAKTQAIYQITPDGKMISYTSSKNQQGLALDLQEENGQVKVVKIRVDEATTAESAINASLQLQVQLMQMMNQLLQQLVPIAAQAAKAGS